MQSRERLVKPDVAGLPDAEELEVDAAKPGNGGFVTPALGVEVGRLAIRQVRIARIDVHVSEQVLVHVMPVRVRIARRQADVLVEVKGAAQGEIQSFFPLHPHQEPVNRLHRAPGRQAQHQVRIRAQFLCDDPRHQLGGCIIGWSNDDFHGAELTTKGSKFKVQSRR